MIHKKFLGICYEWIRGPQSLLICGKDLWVRYIELVLSVVTSPTMRFGHYSVSVATVAEDCSADCVVLLSSDELTIFFTR